LLVIGWLFLVFGCSTLVVAGQGAHQAMQHAGDRLLPHDEIPKAQPANPVSLRCLHANPFTYLDPRSTNN